MAVDISQTLQMIATMPGQAIGQGLAKAGQLYQKRQQEDKENKIAKQKLEVQKTANKIKQAEFRKGVMQDLAFEVSKVNEKYDEGAERDMAISDIVYRHKDNLILSGASEDDVNSMARGDLPDVGQLRTIASTNNNYNKILNPEDGLYSEGAVFNKEGRRIGSATRDDQGNIELDSGVPFDPKTMDYNRVSVQASDASGAGMKNLWTKASAQATKNPQKAIREYATIARQGMDGIRRLKSLISSPEWEGGSLTSWGGKLNNFMTALGMKGVADSVFGLGDADKVYEVIALSADQQLSALSAIKGNASNKEGDTVREAVFGADNPKQAAIIKVKMMEALFKKNARKEIMLDEYLADPANTKGYLGFQKAWDRYAESHPSFVDDKKKGILFYDEQLNILKTRVRDAMRADPTRKYTPEEIQEEMDKQANRYEVIWVGNYGL